jgi:hypothetical protein
MSSPEQIAATLARIDANVAAMKELVEKHLADDDRVHSDLENRMRSQEKFRYGTLACVALAVSGGGGFLSFLM